MLTVGGNGGLVTPGRSGTKDNNIRFRREELPEGLTYTHDQGTPVEKGRCRPCKDWSYLSLSLSLSLGLHILHAHALHTTCAAFQNFTALLFACAKLDGSFLNCRFSHYPHRKVLWICSRKQTRGRSKAFVSRVVRRGGKCWGPWGHAENGDNTLTHHQSTAKLLHLSVSAAWE